jgi:hypothetical protein
MLARAYNIQQNNEICNQILESAYIFYAPNGPTSATKPTSFFNDSKQHWPQPQLIAFRIKKIDINFSIHKMKTCPLFHSRYL